MHMARQRIKAEMVQAIGSKGIKTFSSLSLALFTAAALLHILRLLAG
jgi:hypothetical protein